MIEGRLKIIADLVPPRSMVADIGSDHGKIPLYLSERKRSKKIIATDISDKSLNKLREYLESSYLAYSEIELRVHDGLEGILPYEVDTVILSGMGGILIAEILERSLQKLRTFERLILQPNNSWGYLRHFLHAHGFAIIEERDIVENEKYYPILVAKTGLEKYDREEEYDFGKKLLNRASPYLRSYLTGEIKRLSDLLTEMGDKGLEDKPRYGEIQVQRNRMEGLVRELENSGSH